MSDTRKARMCCLSKSDWTHIPIKSTFDEILVLKKHKVIAIGVYRPFKIYTNKTSLSNFERLLRAIQEIITSNAEHEFIILDDFNIDFKKMGDRTYQHYNVIITRLPNSQQT